MEGRCGLGAEQIIGGPCIWEGKGGVECLSRLDIRVQMLEIP